MMKKRINLAVFGEGRQARIEFGPVDGKGGVAVSALLLSRADLMALSHVLHAIAVSPNIVRSQSAFSADPEEPDILSINVEAVYGARRRKKARHEDWEGRLAPLYVTPPK